MSDTDRRSRAVLQNWGDAKLSPGPMNPTVGQGLAELLIRVVQRQPNVRTVCDLGCGTGYLASRLGTLGYQVTGVDASERLLALANEHYASDRVTFVKRVFGDEVVEAAGPPEEFDLVVSSDVIEHLYRPLSLLETAFSVLRPGGCLVVGTPYHGYLKNLAISALGKWDEHHGVAWNGGHIKFFSVPSLSAMVNNAGFAVDRYEYYGRAPWLWKNMICIARKRSR